MDFAVAHQISREISRIHGIDHTDLSLSDRNPSDTFEICRDVGSSILEHGSTVHVIKFIWYYNQALGWNVYSRYQCCIADYVPRDGHWELFGRDGMGKDEEKWEGEWIIDPWMNIVCRFKDFPLAFRAVVRQWERERVSIITPFNGRQEPREMFATLNNIDVQSYFLNYQNESNEPRFRRTKAAHTVVRPQD